MEVNYKVYTVCYSERRDKILCYLGSYCLVHKLSFHPGISSVYTTIWQLLSSHVVFRSTLVASQYLYPRKPVLLKDSTTAQEQWDSEVSNRNCKDLPLSEKVRGQSEMARWLRALGTLAGVLGFLATTHMVAHSVCNSSSRG